MSNNHTKLETFEPWKQAMALVTAVDEFTREITPTEVYTIINPLHQTAIMLTSDMAHAAGRGDLDAAFDYRYGRGHLFTIKSLVLLAEQLGHTKNNSRLLVQIETLRRAIDAKLDDIKAAEDKAK